MYPTVAYSENIEIVFKILRFFLRWELFLEIQLFKNTMTLFLHKLGTLFFKNICENQLYKILQMLRFSQYKIQNPCDFELFKYHKFHSKFLSRIIISIITLLHIELLLWKQSSYSKEDNTRRMKNDTLVIILRRAGYY